MNDFISKVFAADETASSGFNIASFMPLILITTVFYFLVMRPQQKKNKEHQQKMNEMSRGDEIITSGGIIGTIIGVENDHTIVEIAKDVKIKISKNYISEFLVKKEIDKEKKLKNKLKKDSKVE